MPALFLDRDGVLNVRIPGDYIRNPQDFIPTEGLAEAMRRLSAAFDPIFVVTNQAGVGKGLMTLEDLDMVHKVLLDFAQNADGRIDRVYVCPHRSDAGCACRKPLSGMAWQALADFPDIVFDESWMVGDSASDMVFGRDLGMKTALIEGKIEDMPAIKSLNIPFRFRNLLEFARFIC